MHNPTNNPTAHPAQQDKIVFYNLDKVRFLIKDGTGLDIEYTYEDLVFSEHGVFIIQFTEENADSRFMCWFNEQCGEKERQSIFRSLTTTAQLNKIEIIYRGTYAMTQTEGKEEITLIFTETSQQP